MKDSIITAFMIVVCIVCLFSVLLVLRDFVKEFKNNKDGRKNGKNDSDTCTNIENETTPSERELPKVVYIPIPQTVYSAMLGETSDVPAPVAEKPNFVESDPTETLKDENAVSFATDRQKTLEEKRRELSLKERSYYDEIAKYAQKTEGIKCVKNERYEEYKLQNCRIVRLCIKRGAFLCEFVLPNADFKSYLAENKVAVKQARSILKITDENSVRVAKDSIDIAVKVYHEERENKKELAKIKRKARRQAKAERP